MPALNESAVDSDIANDWAAIKAKMSDEPEPVEVAAPEPTPEVEESRPDRARDESGKFVKAEKTAEKPAETPAEQPAPVEAQKEPVAETKAPEASQEPVRDVAKAPSSWKPLARAEFDKLPAAVKAEIHRRESDFLNGQKQLLPDANLGQTIRKVMEPYRGMIEAEGRSIEATLADTFKAAAILRAGTPDQKRAALLRTAQQFGIDLGQPQQVQDQPQQFHDPRVDGLLQQLQQQELERANAERAARETAATNWMNEVGQDGNPVRPYVNDVMAEMTALVPQIRQLNPAFTHTQVLEEAYQRAIWAHPEVRQLLQQKQQAELEQRRRTENQERVTEAKRAASVNVTRRASIPSPGKPGTMDETLKETARALGLVS